MIGERQSNHQQLSALPANYYSLLQNALRYAKAISAANEGHLPSMSTERRFSEIVRQIGSLNLCSDSPYLVEDGTGFYHIWCRKDGIEFAEAIPDALQATA